MFTLVNIFKKKLQILQKTILFCKSLHYYLEKLNMGLLLLKNKKFILTLILLLSFIAGFCTMCYEVLWFRVLKFFVDSSIHSFAIMLICFLTGMSIGSFIFSKFIDVKKDLLFLAGLSEIFIAIFSLSTIYLIPKINTFIDYFTKTFGESWGAEILIRFIIFLIVMFIPTAIIGGVFPLICRIYFNQRNGIGKSVGEIYGINTIGAVFGSFASGFILIPLLGVQNGIVLTSIFNLIIGVIFTIISKTFLINRIMTSLCSIIIFTIIIIILPQNAFLSVYTAKYPSPQHTLLYIKENINGTTAVFKDSRKEQQKYLLIDNTGEVSTDYFSMRAFRFLSVLPVIYCSEAKTALIVTFGSGIVAGSIACMPEIKKVDCVEICKEAFNAAINFSYENHDVLHNPKINFIINDGRNYILTTKNKYDIISADATHPTSSDSWILYTKEFYELCKKRLATNGVMCQWIPLHGVLEKDYKIILKTFNSVFPYVCVFYSGGYKTFGHTVLIGSNEPLQINFQKAQMLLENNIAKNDLAYVNIYSIFDIFNGFLFDQNYISDFLKNNPINTDDKPRIIFSKFELEKNPYMDPQHIVKKRQNISNQIIFSDSLNKDAILNRLEKNFKANEYLFNGLCLEYKESIIRMKQNFNQNKKGILNNLYESKNLFEQIISNYQNAVNLNPEDYNAKFLLMRIYSEYEYLNSFINSLNYK